jgi:hypothetical protein
MILLNFSHPLTPHHLEQVEVLAAQDLDQVINLQVQFDNSQPFIPQLEDLISQIPLSPEKLQSTPIVVNLPALNFISAMLLTELHGLMGYFPAILRLRLVPGSIPPSYEVAEVINLQNIREAARKNRY